MRRNPAGYAAPDERKRRMIQRILVGLDGSPLAESILPYVTELARSLNGDVTLLTVVHEPEDVDRHHSTAQQYLEAASTVANDYLHGVEQRMEKNGVNVHKRVVLGDAASAIVRTAKEEERDLIALATHGRTGLKRWFYGSVAEDVLHNTRTPILLVRPRDDDPQPPEFNRIVVPLDGSPFAETVLPFVTAIATATGSPVELVRAIEPMYLTVDPSGTAAAYQEILDGLREAATSYLEGIADQLRAERVTVDYAVQVGSPAGEIVDYAHTHPGTLVILATHGRTGVIGAVMGSVARRVVQHTSAPVLLVHPGREA